MSEVETPPSVSEEKTLPPSQGEGDQCSQVKCSQPTSQSDSDSVPAKDENDNEAQKETDSTEDEDLKRGSSQLSQSSQENPTKKAKPVDENDVPEIVTEK